MSGGRMQSSQETSSSTSRNFTRSVLEFASSNSKSPPSARSSCDNSATASATAELSTPDHGLRLHLTFAKARECDRVQTAEAAAHERHDLIRPFDEMHAA